MGNGATQECYKKMMHHHNFSTSRFKSNQGVPRGGLNTSNSSSGSSSSSGKVVIIFKYEGGGVQFEFEFEFE